MSLTDEASSTIRLSFGLLPFFAPESVAKAPEAVIAVPLSYAMACSYRTGTEAFLKIGLV